MNQVVKVEINENGEVTVSVEGIQGSSCTDVTKTIETALGKTTKSNKTDDYYKQPKKTQKLRG